jgi:hypothetical protein
LRPEFRCLICCRGLLSCDERKLDAKSLDDGFLTQSHFAYPRLLLKVCKYREQTVVILAGVAFMARAPVQLYLSSFEGLPGSEIISCFQKSERN